MPRNVVFSMRCMLGDLELAPPVSQFGAEENMRRP